MGSDDVKVTAMNMYKYKERLRLYKRWPCSTTLVSSHDSISLLPLGKLPATYGHLWPHTRENREITQE